MTAGMRRPHRVFEGGPLRPCFRWTGALAVCPQLIVFVFLLLPAQALAWGDSGHTAVNGVAAEKLPAEVPGFMRAASARIAWLGPEPDRWRSPAEAPLRDAQAPDHYIDLERVNWLRPLPPDRYRYVQAIYEYRAAHPNAGVPLPEKIGFQPYITIEIYDRLKVAFRQYRQSRAEHRSTANAEADAIFYAGWLGHYVADGSNPMHTSIHYNGWLGANPNGYTTSHEIHTRMEATFVDANPEVTRFADLVGRPRHLDHPFDDYVAYLRDSQSMIERCYQLEKRGGFDGHGTPESREFIRRQLGRGAQMLLNLWYTAWVDSAIETPPQ
jgi:hypothetical protein